MPVEIMWGNIATCGHIFKMPLVTSVDLIDAIGGGWSSALLRTGDEGGEAVARVDRRESLSPRWAGVR
jgi:hypothetical protein